MFPSKRNDGAFGERRLKKLLGENFLRYFETFN